jgi:hypothetical protein
MGLLPGDLREEVSHHKVGRQIPLPAVQAVACGPNLEEWSTRDGGKAGTAVKIMLRIPSMSRSESLVDKGLLSEDDGVFPLAIIVLLK